MKLAQAIEYAAKKHEGQMRKYSGIPYIDHPLQVMHLVMHDEVLKSDENAAIIAVLHDVVEDTVEWDFKSRETEINFIRLAFNEYVSLGVRALTNEYTTERYPNKNRAERHELENLRLASVSPTFQRIKLFDRLVNLKDLGGAEPGFVRLYIRETTALVGAIGIKANKDLARHVLLAAEAEGILHILDEV